MKISPKEINEMLKPDSISEIEAMQDSSDERLQKAGNYEAQNKLMASELKHMALSMIHSPIAFLNNKRKEVIDYFNTQFSADYQDKIKDIPDDSLQEPKYNIAISAMSGISQVLDQESLHNAYLNTLAKASDTREDDTLYYSFLEIIQKLGSEGLALFTNFVVRYQAKEDVFHYPPIYHSDKNYINFSHRLTPEFFEVPKASILDNWEQLGLITKSAQIKEKKESFSSLFSDSINNTYGISSRRPLIGIDISNTIFN